ncbi:MAG: AAA family ATPase [Candidatus Yonathbacteria bacterium]|nr:AAA family ATPase [Candidatus Yonathbacteria bacterium]
MFSLFNSPKSSPEETVAAKNVRRPLSFLFYGRSGSGKGTQAKLLEAYLKKETGADVLYIETGKGLRDLAGKDKLLTGRLTKDVVMSEGGLMPEFLPIWVWADVLVNNYTGGEHLILDGLARRVDEVPVLSSAFRFFGIDRPYIIYLNVSRERAFTMLKGRGRADDTDESINRRLDWFDNSVQFALESIKSVPSYRYIEINGEQDIEKVQADIVAAIEELKS